MSKNSGRTAYINARLIDPASGLDKNGALLVENGLIADFGPQLKPPDDAQIIDAAGACLAPGLVDMRVATGEPGNEHKESFITLGEAAAAGGVTSLACLPNTDPLVDNVAGIAYLERRARQTKSVKCFPYAALTVGGEGNEMTEMGLLAEAGAIGFTDGAQAVSNLKLLRRIFSYARSFNLLVLQPATHPALSDGAQMNAGEMATRLGLAGLPPEAEPLQVMIDLRMAEASGARLHIGPISMAESVELIRSAKSRGVKVTCSTAPPYFTLTENDVGDYRTFAKAMPPLRSDENRKAIAEAVADGTIDAICSNHAPEDVDVKRVPFAQAAYGMVGLETLLPLSLSLVHEGHMKLPELLKRLTSTPADILGLKAGRLAKGAAADLVIFDTETPWKISADRLRSKSKNTPYDGFPVMGCVKHTVVDGRPVFTHKAEAKAA
ncbi:MAG TPA: dihydroorotase [Alphaproteobacteria bacterium]|nr:dihydroorotase [Alphaproteobacteria bacterium]